MLGESIIEISPWIAGFVYLLRRVVPFIVGFF
jgi:hypothetical protein